ncbi:MAG: T9SS type A sorting domain-containing protein [Bacteroidia bacterium]
MKKLYLLICLSLVFSSIYFQAHSQDVNNRKFNPNQPVFFTPKSHDPNFLKSGKLSDKSFYQRKSEWKHIIDSTWGPGAPLEEKLLIFNTYAKKVHDTFSGFRYLKIDYDSLYNRYLIQINDSTSKGAFASIMSHFAYDLKDEEHTFAHDKEVVQTAMNPGVPLFYASTKFTVEHFGAVTTVLNDTSTLVLRVAPNHPLNLEPGDIILGYEGVPWKKLIRELMESGIPMIAANSACQSADTYFYYSGAGMNWHLFNTIDILKYSTGDTLHLSVQPMVNFTIPPMVYNEQLAIENISFPNSLPYNDILLYPAPAYSDTVVTYGILNNSNIGYVYMFKEAPNILADIQFYDAVNALKKTDALIIDLRKNYGGWAEFDQAFRILFNESQKTLEEAPRCNANTIDLCPASFWDYYKIEGTNSDFYNRPIAVLLGPSCESAGDVTAQRLRYLPMVRFFGASTPASYSFIGELVIPGWALSVGYNDMFHLNDPGNYLNGKEFPIDYPVWFNKDDVAKGIDPIVEKSLDWINNLAYGHDLNVLNGGLSAVHDTIKFNAIIENPNSHTISARLIFENLDGKVVDSLEMNRLNPADGKIWEGIWNTKGLPENMYRASIKVHDQTNGTSFSSKRLTRLTTAPLIVDSLSCEVIPGSKLSIQPFLKSLGKTLQLNKITVKINSTDPWVKGITPLETPEQSIKPGQTKRTQSLVVSYNAANSPNYINLKIIVNCDGWPYWVKDTTILLTTYIKPEQTLSLSNSLDQNYPNPFNSSTIIGWQLARSSRATLKVFDLVGREVATLVDEHRPSGKYETQFNAAMLPKGVYFYQLKAGEYSQTRKLIVIK